MPKQRSAKLITPTKFAEQIAVRRQSVFEAIQNGRLPVYDKTGKRLHPGETEPRKFLKLEEARATRTMAVIGAIFTYAIKRGLRADNPAHGVDRHAYSTRNRRLSDDEYAALGETLRSMQATAWPMPRRPSRLQHPNATPRADTT
jgi:hypothetical protein